MQSGLTGAGLGHLSCPSRVLAHLTHPAQLGRAALAPCRLAPCRLALAPAPALARLAPCRRGSLELLLGLGCLALRALGLRRAARGQLRRGGLGPGGVLDEELLQQVPASTQPQQPLKPRLFPVRGVSASILSSSLHCALMVAGVSTRLGIHRFYYFEQSAGRTGVREAGAPWEWGAGALLRWISGWDFRVFQL